MGQTLARLQRKIAVAGDLQTVVQTMKVMSASSIGQYEKSMQSLTEYFRIVELGLGAYFRDNQVKLSSMLPAKIQKKTDKKKVGIIVFGSDQGLVGQFNEVATEYAVKMNNKLPGGHKIWSVGERVHTQLIDASLQLEGTFSLPSSVRAITPLIGEILLAINTDDHKDYNDDLYLIYNRRCSGTVYAPVCQQLLPLNESWQTKQQKHQWPTGNIPEVIGKESSSLRILIREYLFVSLFRACTESLASENASRLAAMQRADKNIAELLEDLNGSYYRLRQSEIDEELFDVISGFEALTGDSPRTKI